MSRISRRPVHVALACLALLSPPLLGQTASLVRDLDSFRTHGDLTPNPRRLVSALGKVFFTANDHRSGSEVWVSDGTPNGTELLADACREDCDLELEPGIALDSGTGTVFWRVGAQLWRSDGTRKGTFQLQKSSLNAYDGYPVAFIRGALYLIGCEKQEDKRCGLWRSDGTEAGTRLVGPSYPAGTHVTLGNLQAVGELVYFSSYVLAEGESELWKSDGTTAGTVLVKRFDGSLQGTGAAGRRLFFVVRTPEGQDLWRSDGTAQGTLPLVSLPLNAQNPNAEIRWLKPFGDKIYFVADDVIHGWEIWSSDGTPEGTRRVTDFDFHDPFRNGRESEQFETVGTKIVFFATDGLTDTQLWASESTPGSRVALADLCSEADANCSARDFTGTMVKLGDKVFFAGPGQNLWSTDGTPGATRRLADTCSGCGAMTSRLFSSGGALYFTAETRSGNELWRSNGTAAGTRPFAPLKPDESTYDMELAVAGGKAFFTAGRWSGQAELWASDGTPEGTGQVADIVHPREGVNPEHLTPVGNRLFFTACGLEGLVWRSDGTAAATLALTPSDQSCRLWTSGTFMSVGQRVLFIQSDFDGAQVWGTDGNPGGTLKLTAFEDGMHSDLVQFKGRAFFRFEGQIWQSDGTLEGTRQAFDLPAEAEEAFAFTSFGSNLYFLANGQLWKSDGTAAGTAPLTDPDTRSSFLEKPLYISSGSTLYLVGGRRLWRTDGTAAGTFPVPNFSSNFELAISDAVEFGGELYFFGKDSLLRKMGLWRWNGTREHAVLIRELPELDLSQQKVFPTVFKGRLFFAADDGIHGRELWQSDGTAAGTALVLDIVPGLDSSSPTGLTTAAETLFFAADDAIHGRELWRSDGTAAGTRLVQDVNPGAASSDPLQLTAVGDQLFFSADDGLSGQELWVLNLATATGTCQPSPTALCLGGRFKVEAFWQDYEERTGRGQAVGLTADTGYFWFFGPENVEVVVKVLNGQGVNGHFWVFYGALSNVQYSLTVTDTQTGLARRYSNLLGRFASVGDTNGFGPLGAYSTKSTAPNSPPALVSSRVDAAAATGTCVPGATRLCLNGGRFAVEATWKDFSGGSGTGKAVPLTGDTGYFWFFDAANVEAVVKVLDGTQVNGKHWVFYGALSNVEYTLSVTDTLTGQVKTYKNPSGRFASVGDTGAF